jgi:transcriptional regulator with XRE-family HTH domain
MAALLGPIQGQIKMVMPNQDQPPEQVRKALGQRIKNLRIKKAWSQKLLAELSGINLRYIAQIERGELDVRLSILIAIAKVFRIPASHLIRGIVE